MCSVICSLASNLVFKLQGRETSICAIVTINESAGVSAFHLNFSGHGIFLR